jgi:hypothetical protein
LIDGEVVFSEEIVWDPYFQSDPNYHIEGIHDSLLRAAAHLPRVDAIGGSTAGVIMNREVRASSLFRGVSHQDYEAHVRHIFSNLKKRWKGVPFEVVNDGEVTALAGSMGLQANSVLGIAMGTGTDAAMEAGDLTIVSGDLSVVPKALALSRRTLKIIRANLFWAFAYNTAAIPLAALGYLNPMWAGLAMALSSIFVVTNSLRLRTTKLTPHTAFVHATR